MDNQASLAKLQKLATLEKQLWGHFIEAEKGAQIGLLNAKRQFQVWVALKNKNVGLSRYYPFLQFLPLIIALTTLFFNGVELAIALLFYLISLCVAAYTYKRFSNAYTQTLTGRSDLVRKAFGIDQISHRTFMMFERISMSGALEIDEKSLESIIKLVKSAQEHEAATLGYADYFHRTFVNTIFTLPFVLPTVYVARKNEIDTYFQKFKVAYADGRLGPEFLVSVIVLLTAAVLLIYMLGYGERAVVRKKKRYLLMLNVLKESYVGAISPGNDETVVIQDAIDVLRSVTQVDVKKNSPWIRSMFLKLLP